MLLAGSLGSRVENSVHCVNDATQQHLSSIIYTVHTVLYPAPQGSSQQHPVLDTICSSLQSGTPEDGRSGAWNMLS